MSGQPTTQVRIEPPTCRRHEERNGDRYAEPVTVEFDGLGVMTDRT